jgi:hypothetical protein
MRPTSGALTTTHGRTLPSSTAAAPPTIAYPGHAAVVVVGVMVVMGSSLGSRKLNDVGWTGPPKSGGGVDGVDIERERRVSESVNGFPMLRSKARGRSVYPQAQERGKRTRVMCPPPVW